MDRNRIALVGAELEENLSIRYLASAVERDGLCAEIMAFNHMGDREAVANRLCHDPPVLVGISVPFQNRAEELLSLSTALRDGGYPGHISVGGHFATFEYVRILQDFPGVDSAVRHEGEGPLRSMCRALRRGEPLSGISGIVLRGPEGIEVAPNQTLPPLDDLAFPKREGGPKSVLGVPVSPIVGSRGCYADCSYCCIYAYAKNARGPRYRRRSGVNLVDEMEAEYRERGVRIFNFHDDNFFVPSTRQNLLRYREMKDLLKTRGMEDIGLLIKCRPNDLDPELFRLLKSMGLIRAYVGVETNSAEGIVSLNRRISREDNVKAMQSMRELDILCSFNVLMFDPQATMAGVSQNLDFMESFAEVPFNFCRTEVYAGTPLKTRLAQEGRLRGNYLSWTYEIQDRRAEVLFRVMSVAFRSRNFKPDGIANLNQEVRQKGEVLRRFFPESWTQTFNQELLDLSRRIGRDSTMLMREAHRFCTRADLNDRQGIKAFSEELGHRVNSRDLDFLREIRRLQREAESLAVTAGPNRRAVAVGSIKTA